MGFSALKHGFSSLRRQVGRAARTVVAMLAVSATALVGIAVHEDYRGNAYQDSGGVWTVGFGETDGVKKGHVTTPSRALVTLLKSAEKHAAGVRQCMDGVELHQQEFDAYVSLAYNVGVSRFCNSSIPIKLKARQYGAACATILEFDKFRDCSKPKVRNPRTGLMECPLVPLRGLTVRRQHEHQQCMEVQ